MTRFHLEDRNNVVILQILMQRRIVVLAGSGLSFDFYKDTVCVREGDIFVSSVRRTYYGPAAMPLKMTWTTPDKTVVNSTLHRVRTSIRYSTINITTTPSIAPYFNCAWSFGPPTSVVVPRTMQATNAPIRIGSVNSRPAVFVREYWHWYSYYLMFAMHHSTDRNRIRFPIRALPVVTMTVICAICEM